MEISREPEDGFSFADWLRTGRLSLYDARWGTREVKFNPNHDPTNGRFTFRDGGSSTARSPSRPRPSAKSDGSWNGGGFTGPGGGSSGGGGATGYYMTHAEVQEYQRQHPDRDPYLTQPGDTVAAVAAAYGLTAEKVSRINGIAANARLVPGQIVALPSGSLQREERNGYVFRIDSVDRTRTVNGELHFASMQQRSKTSQRQAGGVDRRVTDDGGHFVAARFDGPSDGFNHFAQDANFNRGRYRAIENGWAKDLRGGRRVSVDINAHYPGPSQRPDTVVVRWPVNGKPHRESFSNEPKGKSSGH